jgi:hypothetical protein
MRSASILFNGANIAEQIDISANGGRVRFTRDIASVTMDLNDVECGGVLLRVASLAPALLLATIAGPIGRCG